MTSKPIGGYTDPEVEWAYLMTQLYFDGPRGPQVCDVIRRYVAGDIADRATERAMTRRDIDIELDEEAR